MSRPIAAILLGAGIRDFVMPALRKLADALDPAGNGARLDAAAQGRRPRPHPRRALGALVTADPRDPAFIEPAWVTCKACMGEGFVDVGEFVETCFDCNGEGEVEP
jgi:hypothetical protein